jgi:hypothetical protein
MYGSITFYDDDLVQVGENENEKTLRNLVIENEIEDDANSENSFINCGTYDNYDKYNKYDKYDKYDEQK